MGAAGNEREQSLEKMQLRCGDQQLIPRGKKGDVQALSLQNQIILSFNQRDSAIIWIKQYNDIH